MKPDVDRSQAGYQFLYREVCAERDALRRAVRAYFRAVDDTSWSANGGPGGRPVNWHKRHDKAKAEDKLRKLVGCGL